MQLNKLLNYCKGMGAFLLGGAERGKQFLQTRHGLFAIPDAPVLTADDAAKLAGVVDEEKKEYLIGDASATEFPVNDYLSEGFSLRPTSIALRFFKRSFAVYDDSGIPLLIDQSVLKIFGKDPVTIQAYGASDRRIVAVKRGMIPEAILYPDKIHADREVIELVAGLCTAFEDKPNERWNNK